MMAHRPETVLYSLLNTVLYLVLLSNGLPSACRFRPLLGMHSYDLISSLHISPVGPCQAPAGLCIVPSHLFASRNSLQGTIFLVLLSASHFAC